MKLYQYSTVYTQEQITSFEKELTSLKANLKGLVCAEKRKSVMKNLSQWEKFLLRRDWERYGIWPNRVITLSGKIGYDDCMIGKPVHPWYVAGEDGRTWNTIGVIVENWDDYWMGWLRAYHEKYGKDWKPQ